MLQLVIFLCLVKRVFYLMSKLQITLSFPPQVLDKLRLNILSMCHFYLHICFLQRSSVFPLCICSILLSYGWLKLRANINKKNSD